MAAFLRTPRRPCRDVGRVIPLLWGAGRNLDATALITLEGSTLRRPIMRRLGVDREDNRAPGIRSSTTPKEPGGAIVKLPFTGAIARKIRRQRRLRSILKKDLTIELRLDNPPPLLRSRGDADGFACDGALYGLKGREAVEGAGPDDRADEGMAVRAVP